LQFAKGAQITFGAVAKGNLSPFFARGIRELHAKPIILAIDRWGNLIWNKTKWRAV
jgi:hypothetical protein